MSTTFTPSAAFGESLFPIAGRALLAAIFLYSGVGKIFDPAGTLAYIASAGLPAPPFAYAVALLVEIAGGLMLLTGYQARFAAAFLAAFAVSSALLFHRDFGDANQVIHFLKNVAIAGGLLQVFAFGAGAYSLDHASATPARLA